MYRRLSILSGFAITAVVLNHAGGWGLTAMIFWAHRFRPVQSPNYDLVGSLPYYLTDLVHLTTVFAVPAFLFISGFFISYAAQAAKTGLGWKPIRARLLTLLIPYLIWSVVVLIQDYFLGEPHSPADIVWEILLFGTNGGFFYIPILVMFYLLSPWLVQLARNHWKALLIGASVIQFIPILFRYIRVFFGVSPLLAVLLNWTPDQIIIRWAIYFPVGLVIGLHANAVKDWLVSHRRFLLSLTVLFYALMFAETEILYARPDRWRPGPSSIFFALYGLSFILTFLAYEQVAIPYARNLVQLGSKSYGIYLTHFIFMTVAAKLVYHFAPWMLGHQILFQPLLFMIGLAIPLVMLNFVARSPLLCKAYPHLFG